MVCGSPQHCNSDTAKVSNVDLQFVVNVLHRTRSDQTLCKCFRMASDSHRAGVSSSCRENVSEWFVIHTACSDFNVV